MIKRILKNNYQLDLPLKVRIHLIFYISLFKDATNIELINTERNNVKVKKKKYETEKVFNIRNH